MSIINDLKYIYNQKNKHEKSTKALSGIFRAYGVVCMYVIILLINGTPGRILKEVRFAGTNLRPADSKSAFAVSLTYLYHCNIPDISATYTHSICTELHRVITIFNTEISTKKAQKFTKLFVKYLEYYAVQKKSYRRNLVSSKHIKPFFARKRLGEVTPLFIERYKKMRKDGIRGYAEKRRQGRPGHIFFEHQPGAFASEALFQHGDKMG